MKKTELRQLIREEIETLFENDNSLNEAPQSQLADYGKFTEAVRDVRSDLVGLAYEAYNQGQTAKNIIWQLDDFKRFIDSVKRQIAVQDKRVKNIGK